MIEQHLHSDASDYPHQRIFIICIKEYVNLVPYVENDDEVFFEDDYSEQKIYQAVPWRQNMRKAKLTKEEKTLLDAVEAGKF